METTDLKKAGCPSLDELRKSPGFPSRQAYISKGPLPFIECIEEIPCNPCESSCPTKAITVGTPITNLPVVDPDKCIGCGTCVAKCPGLAICIRNFNFEDDRASITFPYEYYPVPEQGDTVTMVDRMGHEVCDGEIVKVMKTKQSDETYLISAAYDKRYFLEVISIRRLDRKD